MNRTVWGIRVVACLPIVAVGWVLWDIGAHQAREVPFHPPSLGSPPADAELAKGFQAFTMKGCVFCHGPEGKGGVKNPNAMGGEVPAIKAENFTFEEFHEKLMIGVRHVDAADAAKGEPPLYMPSWKGKLTEEEIKALWGYLSSLAPKKSGDEW